MSSFGMGLRQDLRLKQELQLTPRQILQNEILMLPLNELRAALNQEVEENVFLKQGSEVRENAPAEPTLKVETREDKAPKDELEDLRQLAEAGAFQEYLQGNRGYNGGVRGEVGEDRNLERFISNDQSWQERLVEQLRMAPIDADIKAISISLVGYINDRGMIEDPMEAIAEREGLDPELMDEALRALQDEAPAGVGAQSLQERILLQLKALPKRDANAEAIVGQCYEALLKGNFKKVGKELGLSQDEILEALEIIRGPALEATSLETGEQALAVEPDATIRKDEETGEWIVDVHNGGLPPIRISKEITTMLSNASKLDEETRKYLQAKLSRARWMRDAVDRRRTTLKRIIEEILKYQLSFFDVGVHTLQPLRQETVAEDVKLHPSRVSRAIQEKYVETPYGVFPLKHFFPRGIQDSEGNEIARDHVQNLLNNIINQEDPAKPLSDESLVRALSAEGIDISRRTVCKYRDELQIPSASARKGLYHKLRRAARR